MVNFFLQRRPTAPFANKRNQYLFLVVLIILAGILPKFIGLTAQSLWLDEINVVRFLSHPNLDKTFVDLIRNEPHPPGYFLFMHWFSAMFGISLLKLRVSSALCSSLAVIALFFLLRRMTGWRIAAVSTALMGMSSFALYEAQNVRPYSLFLLFSVISTALFLKVIYEDNLKGRWFFQLMLVNFLLSMIHYSAIFFIASQVIYISVTEIQQQRFKKALIVLFYSLITVIPSVAWLIWCMLIYKPMATANLSWSLLDLLSPARAFLGQFVIVIIPLIAIVSWLNKGKIKPAAGSINEMFNEKKMISGLLYLLFFHFIFVICASTIHASWMQNKNFYVIFPAGYILLAIFITRQTIISKEFVPLFCFMTAGLGLLTYVTTGYPLQNSSYYSPYRDQTREAASVIKDMAGPNDILLFGAIDMNGNKFLLVPTLVYVEQIESKQWKWPTKDVRVFPTAEDPAGRAESMREAVADLGNKGSIIIDLPHSSTLSDQLISYLRKNSMCINERLFVKHRVVIASFENEKCSQALHL